LAALIASVTACIGLAKFWLDRGAAEARAEAAAMTAAASVGRVEILAASLNDFRIQVAQTYATNRALQDAEGQMAQAMNDIRDEMRGMNARLDQFLQAMLAK
jgi:hypothetical protein